MGAQRRSATKQRRSATASAQPAEAPAKPKLDGDANTATKPQAQAKAVSASKESRFKTRYNNLRRMAQNTWSEIKKVTWPDAETTRNLTMLVIAMSTVLGLLLGGIDFLLLKLFETF